MSSKPGMDSIRNYMEITEPVLDTKNTGKTSSKISGNTSCRNQNNTFDNEDNDLRSSRVNSLVADWVEKVKPFDNEEREDKNAYKTPLPDKSEVNQLCETLNSPLKNVNTNNVYSSKNEKFIQWKNIFQYLMNDVKFGLRSSIVSKEYPNYEEAMIKLQKCLRGEAKSAVGGMLISPQNLHQVIETLKMKFGKPEQIIETLPIKVKSISVVKENDIEIIIM
ncbi:hypothetical protein JTB14_024424 [Gonioctena quinquepunctata]|nr:hypothetical protein JTB14_024424 [Gonioctena quinquepunctata]